MKRFLEKLVNILMIITGQYDVEAKRKRRLDPNYDYYGNRIKQDDESNEQ